MEYRGIEGLYETLPRLNYFQVVVVVVVVVVVESS